jgi:hypothetical protein
MTKRTIARTWAMATAVTVLLAAAPHVRAACSLTQGDFDGNGSLDVRIRGDAGRQVLRIEEAGEAFAVGLSCNGDEDFDDPTDIRLEFALGPVETYDIQLGGRDVISYFFEKEERTASETKNLALTLGPGGNTITLEFFTGLNHSSFTVDLQGGTGADVVTIDQLLAGNAALILRGDLGAGDDTLEIKDSPELVANVGGAGRTMLMNLDLGLGRNRATLPAFSLDNSFASFDLEGGDAPTGADTVRLVVPEAGVVLKQGGRYFFDAALRKGDDAFGLDQVPAATPGVSVSTDATSEAHIHVDGGEGNDAMATVLERSVHEGVFDLRLSGGLGTDFISVDWNELGGTGTGALRLDGGDGNDTVIASVDTVSAATLLADLLESGGRGADTVYQGFIAAPNVRFPVGGSTVLDGGRDAPDACFIFASDRISTTDCEPLF